MSPEDMALKAQAERLADQMDNFMHGVLTLNDIGKALPRPYDAVGIYALGLAHDFANMAYGFRKYIEQTTPAEDNS